jgi:leader peptidase (prepilin peptidase)/N-methyltransferase
MATDAQDQTVIGSPASGDVVVDASLRELLMAALPHRRSAGIGLAAGTLLVAVVVALAQGSVASAVLRGLLVAVLVPACLIDLDRRIIPNRLTGPAAVLLLVVGLALNPAGEPNRLLWTAIVGGFLLVASLLSPAGMGMGDVKLTAVMGLALGRPVAIALFVALLASVLTGVVLAGRNGIRTARKTALPFGPYLAFGGIVAALAGDPLVHALLSAHH